MKLYFCEVTYKYKVTRPYSIQTKITGYQFLHGDYFVLNPDGMLEVRPGYCWDGASGPTVDTDSSMAAALVHDVFYQSMRLGLLPRKCRKAVDKELRRICIDKGMFPPRAELWYIAVQAAAGDCAQKGTEPKERVAP